MKISLCDSQPPDIWNDEQWERILAKQLQSWPTGELASPPGEPQQCFTNALKHAVKHSLRYCEGWATPPSGQWAIHHAWCISESGHVVEVTWTELGSNYRGIVFPIPEVWDWRRKAVQTGQTHSMLLSKHRHDAPVLVYTKAFLEELAQRHPRDTYRSRAKHS